MMKEFMPASWLLDPIGIDEIESECKPGPPEERFLTNQISWLTDDCILAPFFGRYGQFHNTAVFDETLDNRSVFCVQLELGTPILRPGGKEHDLAADFL